MTALFSTRRPDLFRNLTLLACYTLLLTFSLYLAYELRFDFDVTKQFQTERLHALFWVVPLELVMLYVFGQFRGFLSYFRIPDLLRIFGALICVGIFMVVLWMAMPGQIPPRAVILAERPVDSSKRVPTKTTGSPEALSSLKAALR